MTKTRRRRAPPPTPEWAARLEASRQLALTLWQQVADLNSAVVMDAFAFVLAARLVEFDGDLSEAELRQKRLVTDDARIRAFVETLKDHAAELRARLHERPI